VPPFPPPLLPPLAPPVVLVLPASTPVRAAGPSGPVVVSLTANVPPLSGQLGVPCTTVIGATCTVTPQLAGFLRVTGSMSYTVTATGPSGTVVGGIPAIFIPTTTGVEAYACGTVTAQLQTTCSGNTVGNALQLGVVRVRFPLTGGGTADVTGVINGPGAPSTATATSTPTAVPTSTATATSTPTTVLTATATATVPRTAQRLYVANQTSNSVTTFDISSGAPTSGANSPLPATATAPSALALK
jgi:hypothetical protein